MNVWSAAGGAARSANDLNGLVFAARKMMTAENQKPGQFAKDKDLEFSRARTNADKVADATSRQITAGLTIAKTVVAIAKIVGGAAAAGSSDSAGKDASAAAQQAGAQAANSALKTAATVATITLEIASQVVALVSNIADLMKANKEKKNLTEDQGSMDAATKALDSTGRA